ncbi:DUF4229 domain-containing protein [Leucobacter chromiireducens subsp. chromiireducens]|uniref:DUF4229 domain-containing protein n=1 Tax=Leucobacter chromiireducens subsp. chromiireducens TaxID=660067 RepID=A0ABS1SQ80_9MICO|nr:DUF4229 domain-containing protein [Leucobacter chromiireducens]MBL3690333.1 DUF4229 domain-containing protein [Leucobacter chromiireducens subsp. chromiireducens]
MPLWYSHHITLGWALAAPRLRIAAVTPGRLVAVKNPRTAWIVYIVLRLLFFAAPFAVFFLMGIKPWLAAIFAALIGVSLSIIFLSKPRDTASESIYDWRNRERTADSIVEDEAMDAETQGTAAAAAETVSAEAVDAETAHTDAKPTQL